MNEVIKFVDGGLSLDVSVSPNRENVWLTADQMASLFGRDRTVIQKHVSNLYSSKELDRNSTCAKNAQVAPNGKTYLIPSYNLDVILAVGYRVKSQRGIAFRHWASGILKEYLLQGYAVNEKRLIALGKVIEVQNGLISSLSEKAGLESEDVMEVLKAYEAASGILDDYDHGTLNKPVSNKPVKVSYIDESEAFEIIKKSSFSSRADLFGKEKETGHLKGILDQIRQDVYGRELYPSIEEKAANLLYFIDKDHVFVDGNKRIAAILFLEFLRKNHSLRKSDGSLRITNDALAALTLLIAESHPEEKEVMVAITMKFLS
jgi:prophage maintenance system killer protein